MILLSGLPLLLAANSLLQDAALPGDTAPVEREQDLGGIVVVATRIRGQLDVPDAPVATLDEEEVAAYGASSLPDLIAALGPQTGSGRGRGGGFPIMLVNGQRISNFREMRNFPPEAIRRMEILPEQVALRFGFPPNQRVVNLILKDNFSSRTIDLEYGLPQRGGFSTAEGEASLLKINGPSRLNLSIKLEDSSMLTEAERGVIQQAASLPGVNTDPDPAAARSLIADSRTLTGNGTWTRGLGEQGLGGQVSLNLAASRADSLSLSGFNSARLIDAAGHTELRTFGDALERRTRTDNVQSSTSYNRSLGAWQLAATVDGGHQVTTTLIDRRADTTGLAAAALAGNLAISGPLAILVSPGQDTARVASDTVTSLVTLTGRPLRLPAGEASLTVKAGLAWNGITSEDTRGTAGKSKLHRGDLSGGFNLALPIASRREGVLAGLGELSANLSAGFDRLSDFGTLTDWSAGLTWSPTETLNLQASYMVNEAAPSLTDLGNPTVVTFNVPVYDFSTGQTALVTFTGGGNPQLRRETQRDLKLTANWKVPGVKNGNLLVEYFRNRSNNVTASFPLLTPAIEAAGPGRVTRDASGRLTAIDQRPVTLAREESERIRWGLSIGGPVGKPAPGGRGEGFGQASARQSGLPGGGGFGRGPRGMGRGGQGRWNIALFHTWRLAERVAIAPGGPLLDLLGGDALSGGGVARHAIETEGGFFYKGFGLRLNGRWNAPTRVRASGSPGSSDLRFGSVIRLNLRAFVDLGQQKRLADASSFFKGARLAFTVDNLFDSRQRVTDASGAVPLSYQPDYLDPRGRVFGIDFRKLF